MLKVYLERYQNGVQKADPQWRIVRERAASANIDCDRGLGVIIAPKAMEIAVEKARIHGHRRRHDVQRRARWHGRLPCDACAAP